MTAVTVEKTIGSNANTGDGVDGDFSTIQLWEDGAPANATTAEKSDATTFVGTFTQGEVINFVGSSAAGKFLHTDGSSYVIYGITSGNPAANDVVTGATSGAVCTLSSGTAANVGVVWKGLCQNQEFVVAGQVLAFAGSSSSSTAYKWLTTNTGCSFRDNANVQTNALAYNASNGCGIKDTTNVSTCIAVNESNARLSNLQITCTAGTNSRTVIYSSAQTGNAIDACILEGAVINSATNTGVLAVVGSTVLTISNSVIIQRASAADHIIGCATGTIRSYNNTIAAPDDLATAPAFIFAFGASGTLTVQNTGMFAGNSSMALVTGSPASGGSFTTSYSDISGTTGVTQTTYANEFQNVNNATLDYRIKAGAAQIDTGTTDSTNAATDIAGTARPSGSAYDVGAWELVAAGGGGGPLFFANLTNSALTGRLAA